MVRNVLIIANGSKKSSAEEAERIAAFLCGKGLRATIINTESFDDSMHVPVDTDLVITLGGDGTVLYAARAVHELGIPILPVNMGTFGYITEISKDEWVDAFEHYRSVGDNISRRLMLRITVIRGGRRVWHASALNEAVVTSSGIAKVVSLDLALDNTPLGVFKGDGMIVATPTGSTGYSLAAGGPILDSDMSAVIITPICPFTLSNRPLVTSGRIVSLDVRGGQRTDLVLTADGQLLFSLEEGDRILVEKSRSRALLVKSLERSFTEIIRDKLHWSGAIHA